MYLALYLQRSHHLFGNRVESFSTEPANTQSQQVTNMRPLSFAESQPESPPSSASALVSGTEFFPTAPPKSNTNNNAFAEWVPKCSPHQYDAIQVPLWVIIFVPSQIFIWKRRDSRWVLQSLWGWGGRYGTSNETWYAAYVKSEPQNKSNQRWRSLIRLFNVAMENSGRIITPN